MKRTLKITGVSLLAVLLFCYTALHFIIRSENVRAWVESELSERTGYDVKIASLRLTPWLALIASGVAVSKDGAVLFQGKNIAGSVLPLDLFQQRIHGLSFEKPVLHLSLQDIFRSSEKKAPKFSIAALDIADGEIVLETGHGSPLTLSAVFVSAKNVNLGAETGLELRADLPGLDGTALLSLSGAPDEKRADIVIRQSGEKSPARVLPGKGEEKKVFDARFRMRAKEKGAYEVTGAGAAEELRWGAETIAGEFNSRLEIGAKFESVRWSVEVKTPRFPMKLLPMAMPLESGPLSLAASGDYSAARKTATLHKINVTAAIGTVEGQGSVAMTENPARLAAALKLRGAPLDRLKPLLPGALRALSYTGKVAVDLNVSGAYNDPIVGGSAWNEGGSVRGDKVALRRLSFKIPFQWTRSALRAKAGRFQAEGLAVGRKGETQFKGERASAVADILKQPGKPIEMSGDFQIGGGGFSTADESKIGENLNAKGRFTCRDCGGEASFTGEIRVEALELLWNKFFGDFKERRPAIEMAGIYRRAADELRLNRLAVSLDSVGRLDLKGSVSRLLSAPVFALEIRSDDLRPAGFYDFFVRDTFKAAYPILGQIGLGGKSAVALDVKGSRESFTVEGKVRVDAGAIEEKSAGWRVGPIALDLPLKLGYPAVPKGGASGAPSTGKLSIDEIKTATTTIPKIAAPVVLWNNAFAFPEPIRLALFGGSGVIEGLAWNDVVAAPADFTFSLGLKGLRLAELTETLGWHRFGGVLSGNIPRVHWAGDALKSDGAIDLDLFDGRAAIRAMEIDKPLSPLRSIKMSARLDALDLEQASQTFEFGRISGALSGTIDNLVISQGQPAEFSAEIHTVDKRGVSQWISVEALNKITVVSSGNEAGSLYGGLAGFFDFFRYSKLGFKAALKNDRLTLRGIESKGGQEYLVVGTLLPPTVNIVSYTQEISFSELMRRLERVKKGGGAK